MLKGILWDNDGVLVNTEGLFYEANRALFQEHDVELTPRHFFDWFLQENCGAWHLLHARGYTQQDTDALRELRNQRYSELLASQQDLAIAGVQEVVARLAQRLPMGIVTSANAGHFRLIHARLDFLPHFRFVLTEESYRDSKPSPEPYLLGLERLGIAAADCLVIEDSPRGVQAARAAGIECIVLRNSMMMDFAFADAYRVVDTPEQLQHEVLALL